MAEDLLNLSEAAEILGVSPQHVHQLVRKYGYLEPAVDRPRAMLFRHADIERLAREGWAGRRERRRSDPSKGYPDIADDPGLNEDAAREAQETPGMGS